VRTFFDLFAVEEVDLMPRVEAEVLETVVEDSVRDVLEPLVRGMEALNVQVDVLAQRAVDRPRPKIASVLPFRALSHFSGGFGESCSEFLKKLKQLMILQGVTVEDHHFCEAFLESHLTGNALAVFHNIKKDASPPDSFKPTRFQTINIVP